MYKFQITPQTFETFKTQLLERPSAALQNFEMFESNWDGNSYDNFVVPVSQALAQIKEDIASGGIWIWDGSISVIACYVETKLASLYFVDPAHIPNVVAFLNSL